MSCDRKVTIGSGASAITLNDFSNRTKFYKLANAAEFLDPPPPSSTVTPKQGEHGVTQSLAFYRERPFAFVVEIHAPTVLERQQMERAIKNLIALPLIPDFAGEDGFVPLSITEEDGTVMETSAIIGSNITTEYYETGNNAFMRQRIRTLKFMMISDQEYLTSPTLQESLGYETFIGTNFEVAEDEVPMVPFDLYQLGAPSVAVVNGGWYGAWPIIRITGPTVGPNVTNTTTGGIVDLDGLTLVAGEWVEIDFKARTVTKSDGTDLSGYLTTNTTWFAIAPGTNEIELQDDNPYSLQATMSVKWRDTYI